MKSRDYGDSAPNFYNSSFLHHLHLPYPLPCRLHRDAHIPPERGQELEQPPDLRIAGAVAHQRSRVKVNA